MLIMLVFLISSDKSTNVSISVTVFTTPQQVECIYMQMARIVGMTLI
ncbi:hypothetical protein ACN08P_08180 [Photobacterium leiognathi subsp. mandapamensis]